MVEFTEQKKAQVNDMKNNSARSALLILLAGALWGTMGIFVRRFYSFGFDAMQVASMRLTAGAVIFIIVLALRGGKGFKIAVRNIPLFLGLGVLLQVDRNAAAVHCGDPAVHFADMGDADVGAVLQGAAHT